MFEDFLSCVLWESEQRSAIPRYSLFIILSRKEENIFCVSWIVLCQMTGTLFQSDVCLPSKHSVGTHPERVDYGTRTKKDDERVCVVQQLCVVSESYQR